MPWQAGVNGSYELDLMAALKGLVEDGISEYIWLMSDMCPYPWAWHVLFIGRWYRHGQEESALKGTDDPARSTPGVSWLSFLLRMVVVNPTPNGL